MNAFTTHVKSSKFECVELAGAGVGLLAGWLAGWVAGLVGLDGWLVGWLAGR